MDWSIIITPIVTVVCSALTGLVTWLFSRKKYHSEVDHNNIENMECSLEFYEKLSNSNNKILSDILERSEKLAESNLKLLIEVQNLKAQVGILLRIINTEMDNVDFAKYGIKVEDGVVSRKKI
jgi:hypothetical protein